MDSRTNRNYQTGTVNGDRQNRLVREELEKMVDNDVETIFVTSAIPFFFVGRKIFEDLFLDTLGFTEWMGFDSDIKDGWVSENNIPEFRTLMNHFFTLINDESEIDFAVLAGDVHCSTIGELKRNGDERPVKQITSSAIGYHPPSTTKDFGAEILGDYSDDLPNGPDGNSIEGVLFDFDSREIKSDNQDDYGRILDHRNYAIISTETNENGNFEVEYRYETNLGATNNPNQMNQVKVEV